MREVVPVTQLGSYMPEHGRIRLGVKTGRAMKSISTFRFTSYDGEAVKTIAQLYGGTAKPWSDPKANPPNQWEVITEANEVRIFLPPDSLSTWYETWPGPSRRCNGVTVQVPQRGPDADMAELPCLCTAENKMTCKPHTRLNIVIPEVNFRGVWRLETKGWHAAQEMPAMQRAIEQMQVIGIVQAKLILQPRIAENGTKKFVVPVLAVDTTPLAMIEGAASVQALTAGGIPATPVLMPGGTATPEVASTDETRARAKAWFEEDEDIVDAEIVDSQDYVAPVDEDDPVARHRAGADQPTLDQLLRLLDDMGTAANKQRVNLGIGTPADLGQAVAFRLSKGRTEFPLELTDDELAKAVKLLAGIPLDRQGLSSLKPTVDHYQERPL